MRKWVSNDQEFLNHIPMAHREGAIVENESIPHVSTLGMSWFFQSDMLGFKFKLEDELCLTKRSIFSEMSRIYDPLGLLSPITIANKILMKEIWDENLNWEERVSEHIATKWQHIRSQLNIIVDIRLNRWIH